MSTFTSAPFDDKSPFTTRPVIAGTHGALAAGHYLGSVTGLQILERGGNAIDAAAAIGFSIAVLEPHMNSVGGEVPLLIYLAKEERVVVISGQGPAPKDAKIEWFRSRGMSLIPGDGFLGAVVPSIVATWIEALKRFGTMRLRDVISPAIALAEDGFPIHHALRQTIVHDSKRIREEWPSTARIFLPAGKVPNENDVFRQVELARMLRRLVEAEHDSSEVGRLDGLEAARKEFYEGEIAHKIVDFVGIGVLDASGSVNKGFISLEDLSAYQPKVEEPVSTSYREYEVFKCGPWTQGPVFLQQLNLLEGYDLGSLGHNSADYVHLLVEVAKLAFADREKYYGDPDFDDVPIETLLSKRYASERRQRIDMSRSALDLGAGEISDSHPSKTSPQNKVGDTTHLDVADRRGNIVSATQSGGWIMSSPVVEGLGFALSTRGQTFFLDPSRNNALAPGKRPRTTLTPSLAFKDGKPFMAFGTPGGDAQDQWSLQFFLNFSEFGMNLQQAIDAPSFHTLHFPGSFYPKDSDPLKVVLESGIGKAVAEDLGRRGHNVQICPDWQNGRVSAVARDSQTGVLFAAASPKMIF